MDIVHENSFFFESRDFQRISTGLFFVCGEIFYLGVTYEYDWVWLYWLTYLLITDSLAYWWLTDKYAENVASVLQC